MVACSAQSCKISCEVVGFYHHAFLQVMGPSQVSCRLCHSSPCCNKDTTATGIGSSSSLKCWQGTNQQLLGGLAGVAQDAIDCGLVVFTDIERVPMV